MAITKKAKKALVRNITSTPHVDYWLIRKGRVAEHVNAYCFGSIGIPPDAIRYIAPTHKSLSQEALDFYLGFMKRVLKTDGGPKFSFRKVEPTELGDLLYRLETKGLTKIQALFYLTWFRYPVEFPELVNELFNRKASGDDDEALFLKFQQAHADAQAGKIKLLVYNNLSGHGLIYKYNGYEDGSGAPITLAKLHENIKANPISVQRYFL